MSTNQPIVAHEAGTGQGASAAGSGAGSAIKQGVTKIHGLGEVIRGNFNTFADSLSATDETRSRNVTEKGMDEIKTGKYHGTGAGVTPVDTKAELVNRDLQGEGQGHIGSGGSTIQSTGTTGAIGSDRVA